MLRDYNRDFIRPLRQEDVPIVAERLRAADREELKASYGAYLSPKTVIQMSVDRSPEPKTVVSPSGSGEPIAILGTTPPALIGSGGASPWLLGTNAIFNFPRAFVVGGRRYVEEQLAKYDYLENYVDQRNVISIRWLKAIGFEFDSPKPYGVAKLPFYRFFAGGIHTNSF